MPQFLISEADRFLKAWVFRQVDVLTIGRSSANDLVLPDPALKVSRFHAAIVRAYPNEERYFVRDLGSLRATRVGGAPVHQRILNTGDVLQIGNYELTYSETADTGSDDEMDVIDVFPEEAQRLQDQSTLMSIERRFVKETGLPPRRMEVIEELLKKARAGCRLSALMEELMEPVLHATDSSKGFAGLFLPDRKLAYRIIGLRGLDPRSGERIRITDPAFLERLRAGNTVQDRNTLLVPIPLRDTAVGFVCVCRNPNTDPFTPEDRRFLSMTAKLAAAHVQKRAAESEVSGRTDMVLDWPQMLVGKTEPIKDVIRRIRIAASTQVNVLLLGETGTGKGVVARAIHESSPRAGAPFVDVDLTNLPAALVESELFGYRRGAFSDARSDKKGRFELAEGGTIFLDEIGALSPELQSKLLKPIAERVFTRLGDEKPVAVDVRIIAATNRDLERAVEQGGFALDLYRRLNSFTIQIPPLRERREDIPLLAFYFLDKYAKLYNKKTCSISHRTLGLLVKYSWPGNIGELESYLAAAVSGGREVLFSWDFPSAVQRAELAEAPKRRTDPGVSAPPKTMDQVEKEHLLEVLEFTVGNITRTAEILDWSRQTVLNKMTQFGIPRPSQNLDTPPSKT